MNHTVKLVKMAVRNINPTHRNTKALKLSSNEITSLNLKKKNPYLTAGGWHKPPLDNPLIIYLKPQCK